MIILILMTIVIIDYHYFKIIINLNLNYELYFKINLDKTFIIDFIMIIFISLLKFAKISIITKFNLDCNNFYYYFYY
jgi:hypothetical protein